MDWRDDVAQGLPQPRPDEPASLRADIVDELADHLHCALVRELLRTRDESSAVRNVIDRFGDPRQVARRLWFDSMKETLMSQRIVLFSSILSAAAALVACGTVFVVAQQGRDSMREIQAANQVLLEQARQSEAATQARLDKLVNRPQNLEFNPIRVRLVKDEAERSPLEGIEVRLESTGRTGDSVSETQKSDAEGVVDFGLMRYGQYNLFITAPNGEYTNKAIRIRPGERWEETIVCPMQPVATTDVSIAIDWPDDLRGEELIAICSLRREGRTIAGNVWELGNVPREFFIAHDGRAAILATGWGNATPLESIFRPEFQPQTSIAVPAGAYQLRHVKAYRPVGENRFPKSVTIGEIAHLPIELVADLQASAFPPGKSIQVSNPGVGKDFIHRMSSGYANPNSTRFLKETAESLMWRFEVKPAETTNSPAPLHWRIKLPQVTIETIRSGFASLREASRKVRIGFDADASAEDDDGRFNARRKGTKREPAKSKPAESTDDSGEKSSRPADSDAPPEKDSSPAADPPAEKRPVDADRPGET